jgi:hypothetical protein
LDLQQAGETDGRTHQPLADPRSSLLNFEFFIVDTLFGKNEPF